MSPKVVSVIGATGAQGGSVVDAFLQNSNYAVRAITRNSQSDAAKALAGKGVEVVQADANDLSSLTVAFQGSSIIYAVTDFFEPFGKSGPEKAVEIESTQGINLAKAAAATSTLEHYIWSTLPDGKKISNGKYLVPHFESKNIVDRYIKSQPALLAKTTFLWITFYAANFYFPMFTPIHVPTAGKYVQINTTPADVPIKSISDARANVGIFVKAIVGQPQKSLPGKFVVAYAEETTNGGLLQTWAKAQGKTAQYIQIDEQSYNPIWPGWAEEVGVMMKFWEWAGEKSWSGEEGLLTKDDFGIQDQLVGLEQAISTMKF